MQWLRSGMDLITCESELHGWVSRMPCPILSHMSVRCWESKTVERALPNINWTLLFRLTWDTNFVKILLFQLTSWWDASYFLELGQNSLIWDRIRVILEFISFSEETLEHISKSDIFCWIRKYYGMCLLRGGSWKPFFVVWVPHRKETNSHEFHCFRFLLVSPSSRYLKIS